MQKLAIFDFDHSLIDDNSDTLVVEKLRPDLSVRFDRYKKGDRWTELMDSICQDMTRSGITQLQLESCLANMPFAAAMRSAVLHLHSAGTDCRILSDANTFFITTFLKSQGIDHCFTHVVSNPATWMNGVLHVAPLTPWCHSQPCAFSCPENMCKGSVVSRWMSERDWAGVCYVGDGSGDICGSVSAGVLESAATIILARESLALHNGIERLLEGRCSSSQGALRTWATYEQLHSLLQEWA